MNYKRLFHRIDNLYSYLCEEDDEGREVDRAEDLEGEEDEEIEELEDSYVVEFTNKLEQLADRIGGVVEFIRDNDASAAVIAFEKIIEDSIGVYYNMGGEGNALAKIKGQSKPEKKPEKKKPEKKPEKKSDKKSDDDSGDKGDDKEKKTESLDLAEQDVGYNINEGKKKLDRNIDPSNPFGIDGLLESVKRRSGIK